MSALTALPAPTAPLAPATAPAVPSRRPRLRMLGAKVVLAVVVLVVASSCARHPVPTSYGNGNSGVHNNFIKGCVTPDLGAAGAKAVNSTKVCECTYAEVKKEYTFAEFKKVNSALAKKPGPLPAKMLAILAACQKSAVG